MRQRCDRFGGGPCPLGGGQWYLYPDEYVLVKPDSFLPDSFLPGRPLKGCFCSASLKKANSHCESPTVCGGITAVGLPFQFRCETKLSLLRLGISFWMIAQSPFTVWSHPVFLSNTIPASVRLLDSLSFLVSTRHQDLLSKDWPHVLGKCCGPSKRGICSLDRIRGTRAQLGMEWKRLTVFVLDVFTVVFMPNICWTLFVVLSKMLLCTRWKPWSTIWQARVPARCRCICLVLAWWPWWKRMGTCGPSL